MSACLRPMIGLISGELTVPKTLATPVSRTAAEAAVE